MRTKDEMSDPIIDEIRRIRRRIAARHGNDPKRLVEHYIEYQKQFADRLLPSRNARAREAVSPTTE